MTVQDKQCQHLSVRPYKNGHAVFRGERERISGICANKNAAFLRLRGEERLQDRINRVERKCMCCKAVFSSHGTHNRLCKLCTVRGDDKQMLG